MFEHTCRTDDNTFFQQIMLGMTNGTRSQERPARRWRDDISDWCGCSLPAEAVTYYSYCTIIVYDARLSDVRLSHHHKDYGQMDGFILHSSGMRIKKITELDDCEK